MKRYFQLLIVRLLLKRGGNVCGVWLDISMLMLLNTFLRILPRPWKIAREAFVIEPQFSVGGNAGSSVLSASDLLAIKRCNEKKNRQTNILSYGSRIFRLVTCLNQKATHGVVGTRKKNTSNVISVQIKFRRKSLIRNWKKNLKITKESFPGFSKAKTKL